MHINHDDLVGLATGPSGQVNIFSYFLSKYFFGFDLNIFTGRGSATSARPGNSQLQETSSESQANVIFPSTQGQS